jgi:tetratricopeptide (TPR) repeat protein
LLNAVRNSSDAPKISIERIEQARAIGDFYRKAHKYDEALMNYKAASDIAGEMNLGIGFAEQLIPVYAGAAECLVRQGRMQEATVAGSKAEYLISAAKLDVRVESVKNLAVLCEAFDAVGNLDPAKADNTTFVQYIFHESKIADRIAEMPMELSKMADYLLKHDQSRIAVPLYQKALAAWKGQKENCDFNIAVCENQLGLAYMKEDAYAKAEIAFQISVDKFTNLNGKDDLNRAKALFNLADAQWRRANFFQSFATHCEAKRIWALPHNS